MQGATPASLVRQGVAGLREPTFEVNVPLYGDPAWLKEQNGGTIFAGALVAKPAYDSYNFILYTNPPAVHSYGTFTGEPPSGLLHWLSRQTMSSRLPS